MLTNYEGIYRNGQIKLTQKPKNIPEGTKVIVTFIDSSKINLQEQEIDPQEAQILRENLASFADDWNSEEMSIYDDYDGTKSHD
ncbi:hypothetical protein [Crocosphaera sp. XPORK-15E]|uniref:hypothetical protein n=1 Tax=Crocosphaera sp. XPORK-15E TaxID=3110247 RepID=UPI002B1EA909|nr:hypothetical protein [Crocosphaera sp. XPORK-15E]MEA5536020.1 hypothetical protein [Crocosphaera sp. XPORK-15E]